MTHGAHNGSGGPDARGRDPVGRMLARWWDAPRRPWWKWLVIALLLAATVTVTALYAATMARDIARHHWAAALDASREAVLAVVGWSAVIIVLSAGSESGTNSGCPPADGTAAGAHPDETVADAESVQNAQHRVHRLRVRLAELAAARERAGSGADPDLDREVASTTARLERARQWLTSAQSALVVSGPGRPPPRRTPPRGNPR